jgi:hypothetical protein
LEFTARPDLALINFNKVRDILDQLTRDHPAVFIYQIEKVENFTRIAKVMIECGQAPPAKDVLPQSLEILERLRRLADLAVADLQQRYKNGGSTTVAALKNEPAFKSLADHTGFQALLAERQAIETAVKENPECTKRALLLVQKGDHARAVAEVQPILLDNFLASL